MRKHTVLRTVAGLIISVAGAHHAGRKGARSPGQGPQPQPPADFGQGPAKKVSRRNHKR